MINKKYTVTAWTEKSFEYYNHTLYNGNSLVLALINLIRAKAKKMASINLGINSEYTAT
jgi:hypothetical protein